MSDLLTVSRILASSQRNARYDLRAATKQKSRNNPSWHSLLRQNSKNRRFRFGFIAGLELHHSKPMDRTESPAFTEPGTLSFMGNFRFRLDRPRLTQGSRPP